MYVAHRDVPDAWQAELERIGGPPNDRVPWLKLTWCAGEPHEIVGRWVIYECIPQARLMAEPAGREQATVLLRALQGPPPVDSRMWIDTEERNVVGTTTETRRARKLFSSSIITQQQWELFRETHCYAHPFWVIQGHFGGHKWCLSLLEKQLLQGVGRKPEWPSPGDLPYAPWDRRVWDKLVEQQDMLETQSAIRDLESRTAEHHLMERKRKQRELRTKLLAWLDSQLRSVSEDTTRMWNASDLPQSDPITDAQMEQAEEVFLNEE